MKIRLGDFCDECMWGRYMHHTAFATLACAIAAFVGGMLAGGMLKHL